MSADLLDDLARFAERFEGADIRVRRASAAVDERTDGEPVTRVLLLLDDPSADTWDVQQVRELRTALGRRAVSLGLPTVSVTLVPDSEQETMTVSDDADE